MNHENAFIISDSAKVQSMGQCLRGSPFFRENKNDFAALSKPFLPGHTPHSQVAAPRELFAAILERIQRFGMPRSLVQHYLVMRPGEKLAIPPKGWNGHKGGIVARFAVFR